MAELAAAAIFAIDPPLAADAATAPAAAAAASCFAPAAIAADAAADAAVVAVEGIGAATEAPYTICDEDNIDADEIDPAISIDINIIRFVWFFIFLLITERKEDFSFCSLLLDSFILIY